MSAFPAASDSHHHRHSDSRCLPRRHLDSMLAYHSILFLSKLGPKGQNLGHTPVTDKHPISGQNAKVLTVNTAESSVFCPEQRTNRIKFRRIDRNCYRRLINDRGSPGDSVLSLSLGFTSLHLQICIQDCRQWEWATRSASVREKRDDTCLFWGAACRLVAGPWLPV